MPDTVDGNEEQAQRVARLMVEAFRQQPEPFELPERGKWHASAPAWIAVALSVGTALWSAAVSSSNVNNNTRRIEALEAERAQAAAADTRVIERLARIEAKLDLVTEGKTR